MVCLHSTCIVKGEVLNCVVCIDERHKGHKMIPLQKLLNLIKKQESLIMLNTLHQSQHSEMQIAQLNKLQEQINQAIQKQRELVEQQLKFDKIIISYQLMASINEEKLLGQLIQKLLLKLEYNPRAQQLITRTEQLKEEQPQITQFLMNLTNFKDTLKISIQDTQLVQASRTSSTYRQIRNNSINTEGYRTMRSFDRSPLSPQPFEDRLSVTQSLSNQYYRPNSQGKPIIGEPSPPPPMREISYKFHSEYHGIGAQVKGKQVKQVLNTEGNLALIGPSIYGNGLIRDSNLKLLIRSCQNQNIRYPMALGICDQKRVKEKLYQKDSEGCYFLNSHGYITSENQSKVKCGKRFYNGSYVELKFKPFQSELHITIDDGEPIIIKISLSQTKLIYFTVRLGDLHDAIEIM
ncbi:unnamed protein product [Paramecium octaurelia]|uniref:Uncharacterized protein n=1 Tax=Paramecium octaurelia TaxID=43137 RepID=A0A8S1XMU1_PAROT|nr:unnamed protein product [Paramecium octaurelia]